MPEFDPDKFHAFKRQRFEQERGGLSQAFVESTSERGTPVFNPEELKRLTKGKPPPVPRHPYGAAAGGIAGGILGSRLGPGAAIPLSVLGSMGGEAGQQLIERATGGPAPRTGEAAAGQMLSEGAWGLAGEVGGRGTVWGVGKVLAPFRSSITPEGRQAMTHLEQAGLRPGLLAAEATESRPLDWLHNVAESSAVAGGAISKYKANREVVLERMGEELAQRIGRTSTPDQVGLLFARVVERNLKQAREPATVLYNTVSRMVAPETVVMTKTELVPSALVGPSGRPLMREVERQVEEEVGGVRVPLAESKAFAKPLAEQAERLKGVQATAAGDPLMDAVMAMPQTLKFADAQALRSRLISFVDQMTIENKNAPAIGKARQMIKRLDGAMERALGAQNPEALSMWREANQLWAQGNRTYNNSLIRRLAKMSLEEFGGNPEGLVKSVMGMDASRIARVKQAVGDPLWQRFKNVAAQQYVKQGFTSEGILSGTRLEMNVLGRGGVKERQAGAIFTPQELHSMKQFAHDLQVIQAKQGEGTGKVWIQLAQGTAIANIAGIGPGALKPYSAVVVLGPPALAYIMTHPVLSKWFLDGVQLPRHSSIGAALVGRLIAALPPRYVQTEPGTAKMTPTPQTKMPGAFAIQR